MADGLEQKFLLNMASWVDSFWVTTKANASRSDGGMSCQPSSSGRNIPE